MTNWRKPWLWWVENALVFLVLKIGGALAPLCNSPEQNTGEQPSFPLAQKREKKHIWAIFPAAVRSVIGLAHTRTSSTHLFFFCLSIHSSFLGGKTPRVGANPEYYMWSHSRRGPLLSEDTHSASPTQNPNLPKTSNLHFTDYKLFQKFHMVNHKS